MAKGAESDSLELLLDTMCNTFGGIIFLAFSVSLMLFSSKQFQETQPAEIVNEAEHTALQQEVQENRNKVKKLESMNQQQARQFKKMKSASQLNQDGVKKLEKTLRKTNTEIDTLAKENKELEQKIKDDKQQIKDVKKTVQNIHRTIDYLKEKERKLEEEVAELKEKMPPKEKISFTRVTKTSLTPYWIFIDNGKIYPLGTSATDNEYVGTTVSGKVIRITLKRGIPISKPVSGELISYISGINRYYYFCKFVIKPDSFQDFVVLRRYLRSMKYNVNFTVTTDFTLYYGGNKANNEASF